MLKKLLGFIQPIVTMVSTKISAAVGWVKAQWAEAAKASDTKPAAKAVNLEKDAEVETEAKAEVKTASMSEAKQAVIINAVGATAMIAIIAVILASYPMYLKWLAWAYLAVEVWHLCQAAYAYTVVVPAEKVVAKATA